MPAARRRPQFEAGRVDAHELVAEHRVDERRAGAAAGLPASRDVVREEFGQAGLIA
jgi:hypothetical protein